MSQLRIIASQENLIEAVAESLRHERGDYSNSVVVFPGKRPAHFLRKSLAERAGTSIIPPRIFSIDNFIEFLLTEKLALYRTMLDALDAVALLYDIHLSVDSKLGDVTLTSLDAFLPLGMQLVGEIEEVALADLPERRIHEVLTTEVKHPKFHSLASYYRRFYEEVEKRGAATRSTAYRLLADRLGEVDLSSFEKIVFAGFFAFTAVERRIIASLQKFDNTVFLFQQGIGLKHQLERLSMDIDAESFQSDAGLAVEPDVKFYRAPDLHGQVLTLAAQLDERLRGGEQLNERTAIVLPSAEALFPVIHYALSLFEGDAYNISLGYPLERTPVYGFLNGLMELVTGSFNGRFAARAYLRFALHPYTKNIRFGARSDITRVVFHTLEEYLAEHKSKLMLSLEDLEHDDALYDKMARVLEGIGESISKEHLRQHVRSIHDNTIRKFLVFTSLGDFAKKGIDVLSYIYESSTAHHHPFFQPYARQLIDALDGVQRSLLSKKSFDTSTGYFTFFRHYVAAQSVPFPGTPLRGLQVLGLLETRNLQFDTIYLLDANEDCIPQKAGDDLLLPQPIRHLLGLETNQEREHLSEYYFNLAVNGARKVHLFYTESGLGKKEKSRFVQKLLWNREREAKRILSEEVEHTAKYFINLINKLPAAVQKTEGMVKFLRLRNRFSASQLDTYLACPLRFYYKSVLRLEEKAEASDDPDQRDIGTLVHKILAEFFRPLVGRPLEAEDVRSERLDDVVNAVFAQEFGTLLLGSSHFLKQQIRLQLTKFLSNYQDPLARRQQIVVSAVEQGISVEKKRIHFTGKIDRVETRNGKTFIVDYKTGKDDSLLRIKVDKIVLGDPGSWRDGIGSFQLPMYMLLYSRESGQPFENIEPVYLFLGRNDINEKIERGLANDKQTAEHVLRAIEPVLFAMIDEILDIKTPFNPTKHIREECPRCPYNTICGTQWVKR